MTIVLLDLPDELLEYIGNYLNKKDYCYYFISCVKLWYLKDKQKYRNFSLIFSIENKLSKYPIINNLIYKFNSNIEDISLYSSNLDMYSFKYLYNTKNKSKNMLSIYLSNKQLYIIYKYFDYHLDTYQHQCLVEPSVNLNNWKLIYYEYINNHNTYIEKKIKHPYNLVFTRETGFHYISPSM